jgi:hypothetical protein
MRTKSTLAFDYAAFVADLKTRITSARLPQRAPSTPNW